MLSPGGGVGAVGDVVNALTPATVSSPVLWTAAAFVANGAGSPLSAAATNWVDAACAVDEPDVAVGTLGVPVNVGESTGAAPSAVNAAVVDAAPVPP